jgi:hypothetical protein
MRKACVQTTIPMYDVLIKLYVRYARPHRLNGLGNQL